MRSWCFDSVASEVNGETVYDREYGSAEFREVMRKLVGNGVYADPANNMQVIPAGGMSVAVQPGYCWINGALGIVDEAETLTLDAASGNRVDLIVARFDLSLASRDIHLAVVKGTNGSNTAPTLTRNDSIYELQLARVQVSASISVSSITDTRYDDAVCGIVAGVIDQIDATDLFAQYGAVFDDFMAELNNVLTGDVAGNLLVLINNHKSDTNNPHNVTKDQVGLGNVLNEKQYCESNPPPDLAPHIENKNNPHGVTKSQVGLGSVLNEKQYCESNPPIKELWAHTVDGTGTASIPVEIGYDLIMVVASTNTTGARQQLANIVCHWGESAGHLIGDSNLLINYNSMYDNSRRKIYINNVYYNSLFVRILGIKL